MKRLIAGTINRYPDKDGWTNEHLDGSDRKLADGSEPEWPGVDLVDLSPIKSNRFDEVRCWQTLEHLSPRDAAWALEEFRRVLKKGGILDIEVPHLDWLARQYAAEKITFEDFLQNVYGEVLARDLFDDGDLMVHRYGYSPESLTKALADSGFDPIEPVKGAALRLRAISP